MIITPELERWIGTAAIDYRTAEQILAHARDQVQDAITDSVHPMLAAQTFMACLIACFEGCNLPKAQRREFVNDFLQLLEPVVAQQARTWVPGEDGANIILN